MKAFVGAKIILAEPMDELTFSHQIRASNEVTEIDKNGKSREGYHVIYPDNYHSWSPKDVFEAAYREIVDGEFRMIDNVRAAGTDNSVL